MHGHQANVSPAAMRLQALRQLQRMRDAEQFIAPAASTAAALSSANWTSIGPLASTNPWWGTNSGRILALAVDPTNSNVVYAGSDGGGVWKTSNGGLSWIPRTDKQPSLVASAIVVDPSLPNTVYVGTGGETGAGLLKSTDGGNTWVHYPGPFVGPFGSDPFFGRGAQILSVAVHPSDPNLLLVGDWVWPQSNAGVYRSTDGGQTWSQMLAGTQANTVSFDPANGNIAYAALCGGYGPPYGGLNAGVYKSTNAGANWTLLRGTSAAPLPSQTAISDCRIAVQPSNPSIVYALFRMSADQSIALYKSTDAGAHWTRITTTNPASEPPAMDVFYTSPNNPNTLFVGGVDLFRSLDGGLTWSRITTDANGFSLHPDEHSHAFTTDGSKLYIGNDGGIYSTADWSLQQIHYSDLNNGLADLLHYPGLSVSRQTLDLAFSGTQDNGTVRYKGDPVWTQNICGDGGWTAIEPSDDSNAYTFCQGEPGGYLFKTTDAGANWSAVDAQILAANDRLPFVAPVVIDPSNASRVYFGSYRVWQSTDAAASWTPLSPDLTGGGTLSAIAIAPTNANVAYAVTNDSRFWATSNAITSIPPASWNNRTGSLPARPFTMVAPDPHTSKTVYITVQGFSGFGDNVGHVFRSYDRGTNWSDISANLPNIGANDIVVDPDIVGRLYVATDIGVFYTSNGGASWATLVSGLPRVEVESLRLQRATRTLRAATYGRSVWDLSVPVPPATVSVAPSSLAFSNTLVGTRSSSHTVTLKNTGAVTAKITGVLISGDFLIMANNCGTSLAAGSNCKVGVAFLPTSIGTRSGALTFNDSASGSPQKVALTGTGTVVSLSPSNLGFGTVTVGTHSPSSILTVKNTGLTTITISSVVTSGDFAIAAKSCGKSLAAGSSCKISISFHPTVKGIRNGTLLLYDNGGGSPQKAVLTGSGS